MNKATRILMAIGLILAVATPALAEFKFNGQFNTKFYFEEKKSMDVYKDGRIDTAGNDEGDSQQFVDQRFRGKLTYTLNDNVAVVYYAEVDTVWGEESKGGIGDGGQVTYRTGGADGVNVETKNAYLDLKFGDTAAVLGIQTFADAFEGVVAFEDMAGLKVTHKIGNTSLTGLYAKWDEDQDWASAPSASSGQYKANYNSRTRSDWDDFDFYAAEAKHKFNDSFTAGAGIYFMDNNAADGTPSATNGGGADKEVFFYGLNAAFTSGNFGVTGFAMVQDGEYDENQDLGNDDYDYEGWMATAKGTMKLENGDLGLRVIYVTEDDDTSDNGRWQGFQGEYAFVNENQMQFMVDKFVANDGKEQYGIVDAIDGGYGLVAVILSGNHKLPDNMYVNWGVGYYEALEDNTDDLSKDYEREGTTLGYEVAARFGKKFFEKVDVSLNASWADYGDFYDETTSGHQDKESSQDPDSTYKAYLMVNVPF